MPHSQYFLIVLIRTTSAVLITDSHGSFSFPFFCNPTGAIRLCQSQLRWSIHRLQRRCQKTGRYCWIPGMIFKTASWFFLCFILIAIFIAGRQASSGFRSGSFRAMLSKSALKPHWAISMSKQGKEHISSPEKLLLTCHFYPGYYKKKMGGGLFFLLPICCPAGAENKSALSSMPQAWNVGRTRHNPPSSFLSFKHGESIKEYFQPPYRVSVSQKRMHILNCFSRSALNQVKDQR